MGREVRHNTLFSVLRGLTDSAAQQSNKPFWIRDKEIVSYSIQLVLVRGRDRDKITEGPQMG
jgi:hypothetical protein